MLKKPAAILLIMLYLVTVSGFALNLHYCFNRLSSIQIDTPAKGCSSILPVSKMKCCSDKHFEVKVKDAHQAGSFSFLGKILAFDMPKLAFADLSFSFQNCIVEKPAYRGPPTSPVVPLFLKNSNFRI